MRLACVCMLLAVATSARAEKPPAEARALYDKAIAHYDLAEYDAAIGEFKQAYELSHEPALLFNIAQAYRLEKDYAQALHFYKTYVALKPGASNRGDAEAEIAKMQKALAAPAPTGNVPPPASVPPVAPPAPAAVAVAPQRRSLSPRARAAIAVAAVGAAALVVGAATGGEALSIRSRYDAGCAHGPCDAGLYARGHGYAVATDVLLSVGVAAAVVATVVALVRPRERRPMTLGLRF